MVVTEKMALTEVMEEMAVMALMAATEETVRRDLETAAEEDDLNHCV